MARAGTNGPAQFAGVIARLRLASLGTELKPPFAEQSPETPRVPVPLPDVVTQLDALGFSRQAEYALQRQEAGLVRAFAPHSDAALCDAYAALRGGRRRFELGYEAVKRRGFKDAPQLAEPWLWNCYYPTPFADSVRRHTQAHPVSPALVYAVMRQESAFAETVESYAGAHGLMQVIDPTARRIAAELNRAYDLEDLNEPDHNIEFGVFYLNKLQNYFAHPALIAAAYTPGATYAIAIPPLTLSTWPVTKPAAGAAGIAVAAATSSACRGDRPGSPAAALRAAAARRRGSRGR